MSLVRRELQVMPQRLRREQHILLLSTLYTLCILCFCYCHCKTRLSLLLFPSPCFRYFLYSQGSYCLMVFSRRRYPWRFWCLRCRFLEELSWHLHWGAPLTSPPHCCRSFCDCCHLHRSSVAHFHICAAASCCSSNQVTPDPLTHNPLRRRRLRDPSVIHRICDAPFSMRWRYDVLIELKERSQRKNMIDFTGFLLSFCLSSSSSFPWKYVKFMPIIKESHFVNIIHVSSENKFYAFCPIKILVYACS